MPSNPPKNYDPRAMISRRRDGVEWVVIIWKDGNTIEKRFASEVEAAEYEQNQRLLSVLANGRQINR